MEKQLCSCRNEAFQQRPAEPYLYLKDRSLVSLSFLLANKYLICMLQNTPFNCGRKNTVLAFCGERRHGKGEGEDGKRDYFPSYLED